MLEKAERFAPGFAKSHKVEADAAYLDANAMGSAVIEAVERLHDVAR